MVAVAVAVLAFAAIAGVSGSRETGKEVVAEAPPDVSSARTTSSDSGVSAPPIRPALETTTTIPSTTTTTVNKAAEQPRFNRRQLYSAGQWVIEPPPATAMPQHTLTDVSAWTSRQDGAFDQTATSVERPSPT